METILIGLAVAFVSVLTIPLAVLAIGIRRQERVGSLSTRPRGVSAAITRRMLDLHTAPPDGTWSRRPDQRQATAPARPSRHLNGPALLAPQARP